MQATGIFSKTPKGQSEIENKSSDLSLKERRVLILVNGENDTARIEKLSLCENIAEILDNLLRLGLIEQPGGASASSSDSDGDSDDSDDSSDITIDMTEPTVREESAADDLDAREFMCNTLLTFANRVRVAGLIEEINAAEDVASLKDLVKPWYHAVSETPGGMYQVDDLRKDLNAMIEDEASN